jgi:hypothetical protein
VAFGRKKPANQTSDVFAEVNAPVEPKGHNLAEVAVDAGSLDLFPSTASIPVSQEFATPEPVAPAPDLSVSTEPVRSNYSRRDSLRGEAFDSPEPAAMLTADRLLDNSTRNRPAPESGWRRFVYYLTIRSVNLGDSLAVRERKALDARISAQLEGGTKFVPVLTRRVEWARPPSPLFWEWPFRWFAKTAL